MDLITLMLAKDYTNQKVNSLAALGPFSYKGSVDDYESLPTSASKGDVYTVTSLGDSYLFDGSKWTRFHGDVQCATSEEIQALINSFT